MSTIKNSKEKSLSLFLLAKNNYYFRIINVKKKIKLFNILFYEKHKI